MLWHSKPVLSLSFIPHIQIKSRKSVLLHLCVFCFHFHDLVWVSEQLPGWLLFPLLPFQAQAMRSDESSLNHSEKTSTSVHFPLLQISMPSLHVTSPLYFWNRHAVSGRLPCLCSTLPCSGTSSRPPAFCWNLSVLLLFVQPIQGQTKGHFPEAPSPTSPSVLVFPFPELLTPPFVLLLLLISPLALIFLTPFKISGSQGPFPKSYTQDLFVFLCFFFLVCFFREGLMDTRTPKRFSLR